MQASVPVDDSAGGSTGSAIVRLLGSGHLHVGLVRRHDTAHAHTLVIALAPKALRNPATHAEDAAAPPWQRSLLAVLRWAGVVAGEGTGLAAADDVDPQLLAAAARGHLDTSRLYREILPAEGMEACAPDAAPGLLPRLHGYQRRALAWMLAREGVEPEARPEIKSEEAEAWDTPAQPPKRAKSHRPLHVLWTPAVLPSGQTVYVNRFTGRLALHPFYASQVPQVRWRWCVFGGVWV